MYAVNQGHGREGPRKNLSDMLVGGASLGGAEGSVEEGDPRAYMDMYSGQMFTIQLRKDEEATGPRFRCMAKQGCSDGKTGREGHMGRGEGRERECVWSTWHAVQGSAQDGDNNTKFPPTHQLMLTATGSLEYEREISAPSLKVFPLPSPPDRRPSFASRPHR